MGNLLSNLVQQSERMELFSSLYVVVTHLQVELTKLNVQNLQSNLRLHDFFEANLRDCERVRVIALSTMDLSPYN